MNHRFVAQVRYPLVFACLLLAAKFTEDEHAKGLVTRLAEVLARVERLDVDQVLLMLRRLEALVLSTIDYDCSVQGSRPSHL